MLSMADMGILKSTSIFNPSEEELKKLGLSRFTYDDNWLHCAKLSGTLLFSKTFTAVYHSTRILVVLTMLGFVYGAFQEGDKENSFECIQYCLIVVMMYGGCSAFGYYHDDYLGLLRMIGKGGFNYEGTLTRKAEEEIARFRAQTRLLKKVFKKIFLMVLVFTTMSVCAKKPLAIFIRGRGKKLVDGEHNLIWNGAIGMYWPFAGNWISYIVAMTFSIVVPGWIVVANVGYAAAFLFMAEELLCEFATVNCTFRHCFERAKFLHAARVHNSFKTKNEEMNESSMEDCLKYCLHLSIKHHHRTLKAFDSLKTIMYVPLFILIVGWAMVTCLTVFLLLSDDVSLDFKLPAPVFLFAEAFVAFVYCNYGQRFINVCEEIGSSIYEDPEWAEYSGVLKSYISIMRGYCDVPNGLSAGGFAVFDHITFSNMISTAYSYIGFILST